MITIDFPPASRVLCAVSGGADSVTLLHMCGELLRKERLSWLGAAHFHHGLREAAHEDERFVRELCDTMSIECFIGRGDAGAEARKRGMGIEEAARTLRYDFLARCVAHTGADTVLTAHTADDNLETLLLNLTRGTGLDGLCGIPPRRGVFFRPLLGWTRADILTYVEKHGLAYREDETNADPRFRRNQLRHQVVPVLRGINCAVANAATRATSLLREDAEYLQSLANAEFSTFGNVTGGGECRFPAARLLELPKPIASRVLRGMCARAGLPNAGWTHIEDMLSLCGSSSPHAEIALPYKLKAYRVYGELHVGSAEALMRTPPSLHVQDVGMFENANVYKSFNSFFIASDTIMGNVRLRTRQQGDTLALSGGGGTKTLKKWMIDRKIPLNERDSIPVIADEAGVIAVVGLGVDRSRLPRPGAHVLKLEIIDS